MLSQPDLLDASDLSDLADSLPTKRGNLPLGCSDLTAWGAAQLKRAGIDQTALESQLLLAHALSVSRLDILARPDRQVDREAQLRFVDLIERRLTRIPLAYLRGVQEFYGLEFTVTGDVLIPRPETELLVDFAKEIKSEKPPVIWDVGTGSGCIAVTCARDIPNALVMASDVSPSALAVAATNSRRHGVGAYCQLIHADMLKACRPNEVTIILSNPPYIGSDDIAGLQPEVRDHEPRIALEAPMNGMAAHERLIPQSFRVLKPAGWLAVEVGFGQAESVRSLFVGSDFQDVGTRKDLAGIERVVVGRKP